VKQIVAHELGTGSLQITGVTVSGAGFAASGITAPATAESFQPSDSVRYVRPNRGWSRNGNGDGDQQRNGFSSDDSLTVQACRPL